MTSPTVLTIILNFRTPDMTLRCAETALAAMEDVEGEILIIDNGSDDGSAETLLQEAQSRGWLATGRLRVVSSSVNGGFGAGMNIGFRTGLANGRAPDFFYLLNSDAFPDVQAIRILRDYLVDHPSVGFAGSFVHGEDELPHCTLFRFPSVASEFEGAAHTGAISRLFADAVVPMEIPNMAQKVDWTAGASLMVRQEAIAAIGGFDERFFLYFEETELCHRARKAGWMTHYVPDSRVMHLGSASTGMKTWERTPGFWFDSRLYYFSRTAGRGYALAATLARLAGGAIYGLRRIVSAKPRVETPHFYRDVIRHYVRRMLTPHNGPRHGVPPQSVVISETSE